jgi:hypothetical protein
VEENARKKKLKREAQYEDIDSGEIPDEKWN